MKVNGKGLYGTRPWLVFGEGPTTYKGGHFNEAAMQYTSADIRFVAKGDTDIYAFFMKWPQDNRMKINSLAKALSGTARINKITLLGHKEKLNFKAAQDELTIELPEEKPCEHAWALLIQGKNLRNFDAEKIIEQNEKAIEAARLAKIPRARKGVIVLMADKAEFHGSSPRLEQKPNMEYQNIGHWGSGSDWLSWDFKVDEPGTYDVYVETSSESKQSDFIISVNDQKVPASTKVTSSWSTFTLYKIGKVKLTKSGVNQLQFKPADSQTWTPIGLTYVKLVKQ